MLHAKPVPTSQKYFKMQEAFQRIINSAQTSSQPSDSLSAASFGLGECLQCCAEQTLAACAALPDEQLTRDSEAAARQQAAAMLSQAVDAYRQVTANLPSSLQTMRFVCCSLVRVGPLYAYVCLSGA